ncbi:3-ketoacyl-CoA thiolase, mitochondrial-like [Spodoptera litura]|uniref:3-ketoacyl-CoA thiolase, mitochondrial-like n=1 Tax=Spodoptera litura TaxID=69820 RepID=A0A9J7DTB6_SPOLT|nr:3-ketoacyl-CoA thiolase, mitochondrial-like [Spodoptera litura]XP_022818037.1 3-ketoacyl-CoA thiolase, mitochondrial-like [Spodoptera litura]
MAVHLKKGIYVVAGKRTPFGKNGGILREVLAEDLFATAAAAALRASDIAPDLIDTVNIGQISSLSQHGISGRHAALKAGIPADRPVLSLNQMSGSAFSGIICSAQEILLGATKISLCGGMETLSSIPFLVRDIRYGVPSGTTPQFEDKLRMSFLDSYCNMYLIEAVDVVAKMYGVTREEADKYALRSQKRWKDADSKGIFNEELTPVVIKEKGREIIMTKDEHPQPDITFDELSQLPPLFKDGIGTSGNCTGANDGASAVVLANEEALTTHNLKPLARLVGWSTVGIDPVMMGIASIPAIQSLLKTTGLSIDDMDLFEIHETYAATALIIARELGVDHNKLNLNGGAISIGHPSGASGGRLLTHLTNELRRRNLKRGLTAMSIAGGQGIAMIIEAV